LNVFQCCTMSLIHSFASAAMTKREYHRTDIDYMNSLGLKVLIFETFNIYLPMAYIAWFKGNYYTIFWRHRKYLWAAEEKESQTGWHTTDLTHGVMPLDFCDPSGCLVDLCITTAIYVCCTQFAAVMSEFATPRAFNCFYQIKNGTTAKQAKKEKADLKEEKDTEKRREMRQWERDFFLMDGDLFWDYVNSVHAFGYTVLFISTFPIAPLFALIAHLVRLRMAAKRMLVDQRRPRPIPTQGVGIWITAIHSIAIVSIFTNAFAIAMSTNFCDKIIWNGDFKNMSSTAPYHEKSFQYFRISRYAVVDFSEKVAPSRKPINFDKSETHQLAFWNLYNNERNAVCYYIAYKLDPFVDNGIAEFNDDLFSPDNIARENCYRDASKCPPGQGQGDVRELQRFRYLRKEASWHVMQMKFRFAVFYVLVVHIVAAMASFLIRIANNDTAEGIKREAYEEQELLYRNEQNIKRNENYARLHESISRTDNLNRFLDEEARRRASKIADS